MAGTPRLADAPAPVWKRLLALPAGRRAKWAFFVLWLAVTAFTGPFAGKLPQV